MSINNTQPIQFLDFIEYPVFSGRQDYHGCTTDLKRLNSIVAKFTNEDFIWDLVNMTDKDKIVETLLSWENKEELDKVLLAAKCDLNVPFDIKNNPKLQTTESAVTELYREWLRLQMTDTVHFDLISLHGGEREEDLTLETLDTDLFDAHYAYNCRNKEFKAYWQEILLSLLLTYYWQKLELQRNIISLFHSLDFGIDLVSKATVHDLATALQPCSGNTHFAQLSLLGENDSYAAKAYCKNGITWLQDKLKEYERNECTINSLDNVLCMDSNWIVTPASILMHLYDFFHYEGNKNLALVKVEKVEIATILIETLTDTYPILGLSKSLYNYQYGPLSLSEYQTKLHYLAEDVDKFVTDYYNSTYESEDDDYDHHDCECCCEDCSCIQEE